MAQPARNSSLPSLTSAHPPIYEGAEPSALEPCISSSRKNPTADIKPGEWLPAGHQGEARLPSSEVPNQAPGSGETTRQPILQEVRMVPSPVSPSPCPRTSQLPLLGQPAAAGDRCGETVCLRAARWLQELRRG
nr:lisH domain-containing protein ARMC9-like [Neomonachus schauinslandi]